MQKKTVNLTLSHFLAYLRNITLNHELSSIECSPESLGRTSTLQASLVVSDIVEPQGSKRTGPGAGKHSRLPSMFSTIAPEQK